MKFTKVFACMALAGLAGNAFATNGMNVEGYGPIATGMGGASMAYDNGTAAMMNNPATLGLDADGSRLDVARWFPGAGCQRVKWAAALCFC
jgi:long-chain fatty acid transport protein